MLTFACFDPPSIHEIPELFYPNRPSSLREAPLLGQNSNHSMARRGPSVPIPERPFQSPVLL